MKTVSSAAPQAELRAALHTTLGDLLRLHAPHATLLACVGDQVVRVRAGEAAQLLSGDLVPPDDWLERGEMTWITQGGALLGLLHTEAGAGGPGAPAVLVDMLTLLLTSARASEAPGDTELLISQLPVPAAWLSADLSVQGVSRALLEWFGWTETEVLGQRLPDVWPGQAELPGLLEQAAAGRALHLPDAPLTTRQGERWVRGEARPYFGNGAAGVLLTLQDVSGEYAQTARVSALMDSEAPTALLGPDGHVLHASAGLLELLPPTAPAMPGAPLWAWPCFADVPSSVVQDLFAVARSGGAARADVPLSQGGVLPLSVRRTNLPDLLVAEGLPAARVGHAPAGLLGQVLALTDSTAVALDHVGRVQFVSDRAAELLGLEVGRLLGLSLTRVMADLGVQVLRPDGEAQPIPDWRTLPLPLTHEVVLGLPSGKLRHMQLRATALPAEGGGKPGLLLNLRDFTALRHAQAKMRHDARHDALTGLLNRSGLNDTLTQMSSGKGGAGAVVALTPRKFGELVAALGRTACDHLLIQVAARLNDVAREEGGAAARLNDTTLAVFLPARSAQEALDRVQTALTEPLRAGRRDVPVQFALGGTECAGPDIQGGTVITDAEVAMQHALRQVDTPEQASVFRPALRAQMAQAFELEDALREAVSGEQLTLLYQPAIRLTDGLPVGSEALLRWNHPRLGQLGPGKFLDAAARTDLIGQVGDWVVRAALRGRTEIRQALPEPYETWRVGVNLNLQELRRSAGLRELLPLLSAEGAPDIEVTAGSLLDHSQETLGLLEQLRSLGAMLSVDDFGDTATNLAALTRFPLDGLKLHPTLTARLPEDPRSVTLVQATVDLAHRLGMWVTAVGVETPEQLRVLRELGCDAAQGYAIAPPLALPELLDWLRRGERSALTTPPAPEPTRKPRAKRTKRE